MSPSSDALPGNGSLTGKVPILNKTTSNWSTWKALAKTALQSCRLWEIVNSTEECPSKPSQVSEPASESTRAAYKTMLKEYKEWQMSDATA
jgi:hypothetical protein